MMGNEEFELLAKEFYKHTGMMAPGKDDCLATDSAEKRAAAWRKFLEYKEERNE